MTIQEFMRRIAGDDYEWDSLDPALMSMCREGEIMTGALGYGSESGGGMFVIPWANLRLKEPTPNPHGHIYQCVECGSLYIRHDSEIDGDTACCGASCSHVLSLCWCTQFRPVEPPTK